MEKSEVGQFYYEKVKIPILEPFNFPFTSLERSGKKRILSQLSKVRGISYTPDFTNSSSIDELEWVIEVKGYFTPRARVIWKLFKNWILQSGKPIHIFMPTNSKQVDECIKLIENGFKAINSKT